MFEGVTGENKIPKREFRDEEPRLRVDLLNAQFDLRAADHAVLVLLDGDRPSCNEVLDLLRAWLDARHVDTHVFLAPTQDERERPSAWRHWLALPARGRTAFFVGSYVLNVIARRVRGEYTKEQFRYRLKRIARFEKTLTDDGMRLLKLWFHLPKREIKKRLKKAGKDPADEIYVDERDWEVYRSYDKVLPVARQALERTSTPQAPWTVIDATDRTFRDLTVVRSLLSTFNAARPESPGPVAALEEPSDALGAVDLNASLERPEYKRRLETAQMQLSSVTRAARKRGMSSVLVFEGWDAAGKGGCIRRLTKGVAARDHVVVPIAAPTDEELAHHYLWRFWRRMPRAGRLVIFDRSWYGRVLVERVEQLAGEEEWRRAYDEINAFELDLIDHGMPVLKFWLHIDPDEQLRRFEARENTPYKKHKLTEEDRRNRKKWDEYAAAVNEMVARTGTVVAPWHVVPANDKRFARVYVVETVCRALERALV